MGVPDMELKPCPGCRDAMRKVRLTDGVYVWSHSGETDCILRGIMFGTEEKERLWNALPRASGGLEGAVRRLLVVTKFELKENAERQPWKGLIEACEAALTTTPEDKP